VFLTESFMMEVQNLSNECSFFSLIAQYTLVGCIQADWGCWFVLGEENGGKRFLIQH
jgi:hypothetical protein